MNNWQTSRFSVFFHVSLVLQKHSLVTTFVISSDDDAVDGDDEENEEAALGSQAAVQEDELNVSREKNDEEVQTEATAASTGQSVTVDGGTEVEAVCAATYSATHEIPDQAQEDLAVDESDRSHLAADAREAGERECDSVEPDLPPTDSTVSSPAADDTVTASGGREISASAQSSPHRKSRLHRMKLFQDFFYFDMWVTMLWAWHNYLCVYFGWPLSCWRFFLTRWV